jgi:hypothetical protein
MQGLVLTGLCALFLVMFPRTLGAQDVVNDALAAFVPQTIRIEYSSPAKLRKLPNYQSLHQKYLGPRLQALEGSLGQLGVREEDIDELVLGWQEGKTEMDLCGFASGRFDAKGIADRARRLTGIAATPVGGQEAYCLQAGAGGTCVVALSDSLGAFGSLSALTALLETRGGQGPSLRSDERFSRLVGAVNKAAPIWGVAVGPAVGDWFRGWMPAQGNLKLDWARVFEKVDSLVYSVDAGDKLNLNLKLDCVTQEDAASLRQVLEGLKLAQQMAWQNQNPKRPNPFEAMQLSQDSRQILLQVTTNYSDLELPGGVGAARN